MAEPRDEVATITNRLFAWAPSQRVSIRSYKTRFQHAAGGRSAPTKDSRPHVQRRRRERADACSRGDVYPWRWGDLLCGGRGRQGRHIQLGGRERGDEGSAGTYSGAGASARRWRRRARIFRVRGDLHQGGESRPRRHVQRRGSERADDRSGRDLQRRGRERAHAGGGGHLYPCHGSDFCDGRDRRSRWLLQSRGRQRADLAQPGYYVPTAGASSETPDSPGYYTPYPGATAELQAQAPVISARRWAVVAPGQTDTPFSSVTIADPNIDTSDSLSIQLTGGGTLADGGVSTASRQARRASTSFPGRGSDHQRARALIFTPSADSTTTTFTSTDTTSIGTSASDSNTSVTVESSGPVVVSVSTPGRSVFARPDPGRLRHS